MDFVTPTPARDAANINDDAGFTIAVTPSADLPAPVAEVAVYGYVKGDVIYDIDGNYNKFSFSMPGQDLTNDGDDFFVFLHANQSRFGIKTKLDTGVGQIRSRIERDFYCASEATDFGPAFQGFGQTFCTRLRHAFGEWDMTPNWTLLVGQTDQTAMLSIIGVTTVDNYGDAGVNGGTRHAQLRLTYHDGPLELGGRDGASGGGERDADPGPSPPMRNMILAADTSSSFPARSRNWARSRGRQ